MDCIVCEVAKSRTWLSDLHFHFHPAQKLSINYHLPLHLHHCFYYSCVLCLVAQSCPTLCDSMDCSPPGSTVHGILQARILEWVAFPTPGELPDLEIEPWSPALQADSLPAELPFLSTRASIRQEKKELNMLMLPPLLGDIWVCIQSIAPSEGLMPARFPLDNIFPKERSGPPVASNCCLFFKKMLILKLIFIEHLLCAWRFSKLFTWMNLHNSLKNM